MGLTIPVAHDFTCLWCWIGLLQTRRLREEYGASIEWRAYELYPEGAELPDAPPPIPKIPGRPDTPTRADFALSELGFSTKPPGKPYACRTQSAHQIVEHAKGYGVQDELVRRIYEAYWKEERDISETSVLLDCARRLLPDLEEARAAILERRYADRIVPFGRPAYATGVYNLPTFWVGDDRLAEPTMQMLLDRVGAGREAPYTVLDFPPSRSDRPYVYINMVATIDGKTVSGDRGDGVMDLGSKIDHQAMRNIEAASDAVMIGAQTLRATPKVRFDPRLVRIVVSRRGDVDTSVRFFTDAPDRAIVATSEAADVSGAIHWRFGSLTELVRRLRSELGIRRLLVEGGSELNASVLNENLVDELFLTVAPKIKLGRDLPTYAGGDPLPRDQLLEFSLVSQQAVGDEVFLRYRRRRA